MSERGDPVHYLPHVTPPIIPATDLGGVAVLKRGRVTLLTDSVGDVVPDSRGLGLYVGDTRMLSCLVLLVGGVRPSVLRPDPGEAARGTIVLTNPELLRDPVDLAPSERPLASRSLVISRERRVDRGLHERLALDNYTDHPETLEVELLLDADMADIFEVRGLVRPRRGNAGPIEIRGDEAAFEYSGLDGRRLWTRVTAVGARIEPAPPGAGAALRVTWQPRIEPGAQATLAWSILPDVLTPGANAVDPAGRTNPQATGGLHDPTDIHSDNPDLDRVLARGIADLSLLVTPGPGPGQRYLAAGIPWFNALFGRDAILASFGALLLDPSVAVDTLRLLASFQATVDDPALDAEPGKIPHEVRDGEMARTGEVPFGRYYGSVDATPLWLILLGETFDWTGDLRLVEELWPSALAALEWVERHGDLDGDGFIEYRQRAPGGLVQHGWKDAPDSIRDRDGRVADGPIALAEVQGYAYDARVRVARLARVLGETALAGHLEAEAGRLRARFDTAFWVPDRATYALALDGRKRPMDAIGSNQGHALWSGIVSEGHAAAVAGHLAGPGLDSGWGLRTFAAGQPGYSPLGYHTGTVWPHDTAIAVAGLRRTGFDAQATRLASQLLEAAASFPGGRLPELFCGFGRAEFGPPVPYPMACVPQAWAAAAPLAILRVLLGIRPNAAEHRLDLERPVLPKGLTSLTISGLRVGDARVDLRCHRRGGSTRVEIAAVTGELAVAVHA
jgi:glycogen debranching enzyme